MAHDAAPKIHPGAVAALRSLWAEEDQVDDLRWAYREAAAVLDSFDPATIRPTGKTASPGGYPNIEEDATPIRAGSPPLWQLGADIRHEALERLGDRAGMLAALEANPNRPDTPLQTMFEALVRDEILDLEKLSRDEIRALLAVCRWLAGVLPANVLPDGDALAAAFARADLLAPCHHLLAEGFVNRKSQLKKLREFLWQDEASRSLMLYGIGGVGKSTLLASFSVGEMAAHGHHLLFVPIDVDRSTVRPHRPHTFLVEAVNQIVRQLPDLAGHAESITQHLRELGARYAISGAGEDFESSRYSEKDVGWMQQEMINVLGEFLSSPLSTPNHRALVTIDTFEEAQVLGPEVAGDVVRMFDQLAQSQPGVRVVFSGRVRADEPGHPFGQTQASMEDQLFADRPSILLKGLDKRSALTLLAGQLDEAGQRPLRKNLEDVIGVVGRNPMCIKLAGRIIRLKGVGALLGEETREVLLQHLRDAKIQAFLFGRILDHFQTERIKPLAYPGLIVRRVTPAIIQEVLAVPCGIELEGSTEADTLYNDLARERTMVEPDGAGGLRYRPELRRDLLGDVLEKVGAETAAAIDRAAVAFYEKDDSLEGRAEEIYHRLRLGEDFDAVKARWIPGLRDLLRNTLVELPRAGRIWLSQKLNITTDAATRGAADQADWERMAALRVERFLKNGDVPGALAAVRERTERLPNSPLFQLESETFRVAGDLEAAREVCDLGLSAVTGDRRAELLLQAASLHEAQGELDEALPLVAEAASLAQGHEDGMLPFRALITHIRVLRKLGRTEETDTLRQRALKLLTRDVVKDLRRYPRLFEETAAELGKQNPEVLRAAVQRLGVQVRSAEQQEALADVFHTGWEDGLETKVHMPKTIDQNLVRRMGQSKEAAEEIVRQSEGAGLGQFTADLLKSGASSPFRESRLVDFFQASVDQGLNVGPWTKKR